MNFQNERILITGATGSWGNELVKQLLFFNPKQIVCFSRGEFAQVNMKRKFNNAKLKFVIGNIRDKDAVNYACKGIDTIFHLAALKHVPICEKYPEEAIKTNIIGTRNIVLEAIHNKVEKVIDVSSDKACVPVNLYGMTKAVGEKLTINASTLTNETNFLVIRGGNAMGSNGSVIPLFITQIKQFNEITVTDTRMTRFFLTLPEAIRLLFVAGASNLSGALFVMKMPSCKIIDLAKVLIEHYGNKTTKIKEIGIRWGEKIDEVLISKNEVLNTYKYEEDYFLIYPKTKLDGYQKVKFKEFSSAQNLMNKEQIKNLLDKGGFLK